MLKYSMYARDWNWVLSVTVYIHGISIFWSLRVFSIICSVFRCSRPSITEQLAEPLLDSDHSFFMLSDTQPSQEIFRSSSVCFFCNLFTFAFICFCTVKLFLSFNNSIIFLDQISPTLCDAWLSFFLYLVCRILSVSGCELGDSERGVWCTICSSHHWVSTSASSKLH